MWWFFGYILGIPFSWMCFQGFNDVQPKETKLPQHYLVVMALIYPVVWTLILGGLVYNVIVEAHKKGE